MTHAPQDDGPTGRRARWVFVGFLAIAALLLFSEHRAHALGLLPYALLLACPLMHLFLHRGHGGHHTHAADAQAREGGNEVGADGREGAPTNRERAP